MLYIIFIFCNCAKFFACKNKPISDLKVFTINCFRIVLGEPERTTLVGPVRNDNHKTSDKMH